MVTFLATRSHDLGAELELQLLDRETLDLVDGILPLLELSPDSQFVKPEFLQNSVEIASPVCSDIRELESRVAPIVAGLQKSCRRLGMSLCSAGTHPFCERLALITPLPRYQRIGETYGYLSHTQVTYGTHVHVGMHSGDEAIAVMRTLKPYLPLLVALSASSPFFHGHYTGFASYRQRILAATRSYGIPPSFVDWQQFSEFFTSVQQAGMFCSMNDIHWDIRPRPHLGTLEVRAMDAQPSLEEAMTLIALVWLLVVYLAHQARRGLEPGPLQPLPWWIEKENYFQASRLGLEAAYVADERGTVRPLVDLWWETAGTLRGMASELGVSRQLTHFCRRIERFDSSYHRQRRVFQQTESLREVVRGLERELAGRRWDEEPLARSAPVSRDLATR